ncbi:hypothetical protein AZ78_1352 [Lysobacter capsici AZ78]|uniref:Uncharacterized protein n=1 Tax=Lysobacter capsici AZ78 TaxID=1444315 RepID=A0A120AFZ6_9GAMM|nr:hypothetical protein AZ78_1352 [Lysobacter capsici AZ78]
MRRIKGRGRSNRRHPYSGLSETTCASKQPAGGATTCNYAASVTFFPPSAWPSVAWGGRTVSASTLIAYVSKVDATIGRRHAG